MNCLNCGGPLNPDEKFCPSCGTQVQYQGVQNQWSQNYSEESRYEKNYGDMPSRSFCPNCGTELYPSDKFCPNCRHSLQDDYCTQKAKPQGGLIAAIVALSILVIAAIVTIAIVLLGKETPPDNTSTSTVESTIIPSTELPTATPEPGPPVFTGISATSTRNYDIDESNNNEVIYYYPSYAVDGNMNTAWSPNRRLGLTPTLTLTANSKQYVKGIRMTNGYCKSQRTYTKNRRITKASIMYNGGETIAYFGIDNFRNLITVTFDEPVYTDYIAIKVLETYYGSWMDIAISEIEVF